MKKLQYVENNLKLKLIQGIDLEDLKIDIAELYRDFVDGLLSDELYWMKRNCLSYEPIKEKELKEKSKICLEEIFDDLEIIEKTEGLENFHQKFKGFYTYSDIIKEYKKHISDIEKIEFIRTYLNEIDITTFNETLKDIVFNKLEINLHDRELISDIVFNLRK